MEQNRSKFSSSAQETISENAVLHYARNRKDIERCWEVIEALRPHLTRDTFADQVLEQMQDGYRLIYIEENGIPVAFSGFRNIQHLYSGKIIYIDDLSTLPSARGKGYASALLDHIHRLARDTGRVAVHLDSGYQRRDAHRLYLNKGYVLASHHFERKV